MLIYCEYKTIIPTHLPKLQFINYNKNIQILIFIKILYFPELPKLAKRWQTF